MPLRIVCIGLVCLYSSVAMGQVVSLNDLIEEIEKNSAFVFNFEQEAIEEVKIDFKLNNDYSFDNIERLFEQTSFNLKKKGNTILIYLMDFQQMQLCGIVVSANRDPLPYAFIHINDTIWLESDEVGRFRKLVFLNGREQANISYMGYKEQLFPVDELQSCDTIFMRQSGINFSEAVVIRGYMEKGITQGISYNSTSLNFNNGRNGVGIHDHDLFRTLQFIPGVTSPDDSATNLNIRGGTPDQNLIQWEGAPLYDQGFLLGMISSVNPFQISRIDIYKTNHGAEFDGRVGGVVDIQLEDDFLEETDVSAGVNLTEGHINIATPIMSNRLGFLISGRMSLFSEFEHSPTLRGYGEKIFQTTQLGEVEIENGEEEYEPKILFGDMNGKIIYKASDRIELQSSYFLSSAKNDNLSLFGSANQNLSDEISTNSSILSSRIEFTFNDNLTLFGAHTSSSYDLNSKFSLSNIDSGVVSNLTEEENGVSDYQYKVGLHWSKGELETRAGYIFDNKRTKYEREFYSSLQQDDSVERKISKTFHHVFIDQVLNYGRNYLQLGLRTSYATGRNALYFSPSISHRIKVSPSFIIKTGGGIYHQFIRQVYEPVNNGLQLENAIWSLSTDSSEPILSSKKVSSGAIINWQGWLIDTDVYWHHSTGLIAQNPNLRNALIVDSNNTLDSRGIDVLLTKKEDNWNGSLFYSLSENKVSLQSIFEEDETATFFANNNQTHILRMNSSYEWKRFEFGATWQIKSGLPFSSKESISITQDDDDLYELQYEEVNNSKLKNYQRLDVSLDYRNRWRKWNYEIGCSMINLLDRVNLGSQKSIIAEGDGSLNGGNIVEIQKTLLPRTFIFHARVYF
ncbi:MAG: TonB-dependent receptor plug domain-containing protein [Saprospiraceae bacterium]|nr:TonB-dependent receptor plug domain-containing protein [Saprospiraceae bacterium]